MVVTILTTREVAEKTGWSAQTINRWVKEGHLPCLRKIGEGSRGGYYLFDASVLDQITPRAEATAPPWASR